MMSLSARSAVAATKLAASKPALKSTKRGALGVRAAGADREMWYPGAVAPSYLDGTMAGDYGTC
jgi:hypothetical protein